MKKSREKKPGLMKALSPKFEKLIKKASKPIKEKK